MNSVNSSASIVVRSQVSSLLLASPLSIASESANESTGARMNEERTLDF